jgi:hypothetical protein
MRVRLTVKLADVVNGVDLSRYREGDVIELTRRDAMIMMAGGWAELVTELEPLTSEPSLIGKDV